ncbi:MAG: AAA family ATPase [Gammaproteobacteria bacterium]|nr:AAA family ATPase [Gammaproteobacteria bacterium]
MLESAQEDNVRSSAIRSLDPLLAEYDSEYQYLFARIYEAATGSSSRDLEENYALPNMARRILEAGSYTRTHTALRWANRSMT